MGQTVLVEIQVYDHGRITTDYVPMELVRLDEHENAQVRYTEGNVTKYRWIPASQWH